MGILKRIPSPDHMKILIKWTPQVNTFVGFHLGVPSDNLT
jgi:hypothetical protein